MNGVLLGAYEKAFVTPDDWPGFFGQVRAAGFDFVDLSIDESPHRAHRLDWDLEECRRVREAAESQGVQIGGLCLSLHRRIMPGSVDPAVRAQAADVFRRAIDLARHLGAGVVQVAGYYAHYEPADPDARLRYLDTLLDAVPYAARSGIILGVENVDGHDLASVNDVMGVVHLARSPWLQCYPDIGNIALAGVDAATDLASAEGHIVAVHVKDVRAGEPRRVEFGEGIAEIDEAFAELARQGWSGRLMLEMWHDDDPNSPERSAAALRYIEDRLADAGLRVASSRSHHGTR